LMIIFEFQTDMNTWKCARFWIWMLEVQFLGS